MGKSLVEVTNGVGGLALLIAWGQVGVVGHCVRSCCQSVMVWFSEDAVGSVILFPWVWG